MHLEAEEFLEQLVYGRGLSKNTKDSYARDIKAFSGFLEKKGIDDLLLATKRDVASFLAFERKAEFKDSTITRRLVALKVFYDWIANEGAIEETPTEGILPPKGSQLLPDTLTEREVTRLVEAYGSATALELRNRAVMELLYASGLRASEIVTLKMKDLHIPEGFLRCLGKGSKQRVVPIGDAALRAITDYLEMGRPSFAIGGDDGFLFISSRGKRITRQTLWRIVEKAARLARIKKNVHPHTLRHCFATHLLSHGANIRAIQEMLGHADIATTQIYTHVDSEKILEIHRKFHPRS